MTILNLIFFLAGLITGLLTLPRILLMNIKMCDRLMFKIFELSIRCTRYRAYFMLSRFQKRTGHIVAPNGYNGDRSVDIIDRINKVT